MERSLASVRALVAHQVFLQMSLLSDSSALIYRSDGYIDSRTGSANQLFELLTVDKSHHHYNHFQSCIAIYQDQEQRTQRTDNQVAK